MVTMEFTVSDMACSACVDTITEAVKALDTTAVVEADTQTKQVNITTTAAQAMVKEAIAAAGYTIAA